MPYEIKRHGHLYSVVGDTGRIHSLGTSRDKAERQMRLLYMLEKTGEGVTPFGRMGGKSKIAKQLIEMFPPHKTFVELFVGAGNIFFRKPKAERNVINDLDKDVYIAMKGLQSRSKYINDNINRNVSREEFQKIKNKTDAKSIIEKLKTSFFSTGRSWNPTDNKTDFLQFGEKLKNTTILNQSFEKVIKNYDAPDTFFFLDPPYESEDKKDYKDYVEPQQVYDALQGIKGKFMITYNDSANIRRIFSKYNIKTIKTTYEHTMTVGRREKTELVITNYTL
jgi:DNA adenine methylase